MQHSALTYAELGYHVFPCVPGGKRPITPHGLKDATTDAAVIEAWLDKHPTANWAIRTDGLLVVDIDPSPDGAANPWPEDQEQAASLLVAPVSQTPRGGRHFLFRQPDGIELRNTQCGELAPHVDTRATGGYIVVSPSVINGNEYRWLSGELDIGPHDLPLPPQWIFDKLASPKTAAAAGGSDGTIPEGQRNGTLCSLAGTMRARGMSYESILAALQAENRSRCKPPLDEREVERIAKSIGHKPPGESGVEFGPDEIEAPDLPPDPGTLPSDLLKVPGFLSDVIDFNLEGAFRPQPVLALAGALSLLATLTGRKVQDTQGTRTNLYCLGVCPTSSGKERARDVNKEILFQAVASKLIGGESFASSAGLIAAIEQQPTLLFQVDEIGRYMRTMGEASKSPHLYNIVTVLMKLFTSSHSVYFSDAYADPKKNKSIIQPHACLYGTTTPETLYAALTSDSLADGFLSRVLLFEGDDDVDSRRIVVPTMPRSLVDQAIWWNATFNPGGNLKDYTPQPVMVASTPEADAILDDLRIAAEDIQKRLGNPLGTLWPRAIEKANKLALLYACSERADPLIVTDAAAYWASELVTHLTKRLTYLASRHLAENQTESKTKRVFRIIEATGAEGLPHWRLVGLTRFLTKREREECIDALIASHVIVSRTTKTATKPGLRYIATNHALAA